MVWGMSKTEKLHSARARLSRARARHDDLVVRGGGAHLLTIVARRELARLVPGHPLAVPEPFWRDRVYEVAEHVYAKQRQAGVVHDQSMVDSAQAARDTTCALIRGEWGIPDLVTPVPLASPAVRRRLMGLPDVGWSNPADSSPASAGVFRPRSA